MEPELEGLLHISELADHKIDKPQDIVKVGDEVEVKILKVDTDSRKIGLSLRRVQWAAEEKAAESDRQRGPAGPERVLSDADVDQLRKTRDKTDETKSTDAQPSHSVKQQSQKAQDAAIDAPEEKPTEESLQTDNTTQAPEDSEQARAQQPPDSTDTESQTGDESIAEQTKTEQM